MDRKIPLYMVTGFLGSGKTTLLKRLATGHPEKHLLFLVNEFSGEGTDQLALDNTGRPTHGVLGGSLFCECKAGDFIRTMRQEVLSEDRRRPLDAVIIETSGIADPSAIGSLMEKHGLARHFCLRQIVTIVSPKRFLSLYQNLPAVRAQIESSDTVILNKTDLAEAVSLLRIEALIREHNLHAKVVRTTYCRHGFDFSASGATGAKGEISRAEANPFSTSAVLWPAGRSLQEAREWIHSLPDTILRIKGGIQTPEGYWSVDRTVDDLTIEPENDPRHLALVLIAHDDHAADLEAAGRSLPGSDEALK